MPRPSKTSDAPAPNLIDTLDAIAGSGLCSPSSDFGATRSAAGLKAESESLVRLLRCCVLPPGTGASASGREGSLRLPRLDMSEGLGSGSWPWRAIVVAGVDVKSNNRRSIDELAREQGVDELWAAHGVDIGDAQHLAGDRRGSALDGDDGHAPPPAARTC